jgi:restriction system protein
MGRKRQNSSLPTFDDLMIPLVKALIQLGGSGAIEEVNNKVYEITGIPDDVLQIPHGEDGTTNEVDYRLAWARTYLKKYGLLENSSRGIWALAKSDIDLEKLDQNEIVRTVREQNKLAEPKVKSTKSGLVEEEVTENVENTESGKRSF